MTKGTRYFECPERCLDEDDSMEIEEVMDLELALIEFFKDSFPSTTECHVISGISGRLVKDIDDQRFPLNIPPITSSVALRKIHDIAGLISQLAVVNAVKDDERLKK